MLILESPLYVLLPTVSRDTLSVVFRTHMTCGKEFRALINDELNGFQEVRAHRLFTQHSDAAIEERFRAQVDSRLDWRFCTGRIGGPPVQLGVLEKWASVVVAVLLRGVLACVAGPFEA